MFIKDVSRWSMSVILKTKCFMKGMHELFACTCIKHISTNVMKLQATLKQISMKKTQQFTLRL